MSKETYIQKMYPYAERAAQGTGIPATVIINQWGLETGWGTSSLVQRAKNHGGIKYTSNADYKSGMYAGYHSIDNFVKDYIRVMKLPFYDKVRSAEGIEDTVKALNDSPYAEDKRYGEKILNLIKSMTGMDIKPTNIDLNNITNDVHGMSNEELKKYAGIGLAAVLIVSMLNK